MVENSNKVTEVIEVSLGWLDVISLFSGIASLVMGGLAIWLSITFYKMSDTSSKDIKSSSEKINNNVEKLEKMFDTMYSDTFGMVKDTVLHMRQQVDRSSNGIDVTQELEDKINSAISKNLQKVPTENLTKDEVKDLVLKMLKESKEIEIEVKKNVIEDEIITILTLNDGYTYIEIMGELVGLKYTGKDIFDTIIKLMENGVLENSYRFNKKGDKVLLSHSPIRLRK